jgi:RNA polymerase sigma factor (sigma-70 family)
VNSYYSDFTDEELLDRLGRQNDENSFEELFRKTGNSVASEDIVQELFVSFWLNRAKCSIETSVKGYLMGMLRHYVVKYYNREQSRIPVDLAEASAVWDTKTDEQIQFNQLNDLYEQSLLKLPEKCRAVFIMSRRGYSIKEVASTLLISEKTVEAHISKALRILRDEMKDYTVFVTVFGVPASFL